MVNQFPNSQQGTSRHTNIIVLVHGYSASGESFEVWEKKLEERGYDVRKIHTCSYITLTNEITIKDIAEGFDRALRIQAELQTEQEFDAIVHSTGMLVIRAWLTAFPQKRRHRLKHLIALAPASFGSPLAHKGRSWLGALFKGNRQIGPDFMEAGDLVLDGLELGSRFTWDLAHKDLLCDDNSTINGQQSPKTKAFYGSETNTPYVFILCGTQPYQGLGKLVTQPGTDGTVRWAGCGLNTRKIILDLTNEPQIENRIHFGDWVNVGIAPVVLMEGLNHGTIISDPSKALVEMVDLALQVSSETDFNDWYQQAEQRTRQTFNQVDAWQQFIVRTVDERGDPITDYNIQLFTQNQNEKHPIKEFEMDVHTYSRDKSLRCFHVNLSAIKYAKLNNLWMRVIASSGSQLIGYSGHLPLGITNTQSRVEAGGVWDAALDISNLLYNKDIKFFYPFTTTLIELQLNREPYPLRIAQTNKVCWFLERKL